MTLFVSEIVTPPEHLPVTVTAAQTNLARAVVDECERAILWRAIVRQERRIVIDGFLGPRLELEPVLSVVSLTRWTPTDDAAVVDAASYDYVTRESGRDHHRARARVRLARALAPYGSFALTYTAGFVVTPEPRPRGGRCERGTRKRAAHGHAGR